MILCDLDEENVAALKQRTGAHSSRTEVLLGDANKLISKLVSLTPPRGLNFAFIDPFGLMQIERETLLALARVPRMDMLIHFSTQGFKRNLHQGSARNAEKAFGVAASGLTKPGDFTKVIDGFRGDLVQLKYTGEQVRSIAIKNETQSPLYHLLFVSKSERGDKIWNSICQITSKGERDLFSGE